MGNDSTHWRTGTWGMTCSTRCVAFCAMGRAPHDGQNPRLLQLKATSLSCPQSPQRRRCEAVRQDAAFEEGGELPLHELRQVGAGGSFDVGEEGRGVLLHQAV